MSPGSDFEVPISSPVELIIRGDAFEVSYAGPLGRVMGLEYFFRARETTAELNRPIPRIYGTDMPPRIIVRGWQGGLCVWSARPMSPARSCPCFVPSPRS